jgi:hypothetical protein
MTASRFPDAPSQIAALPVEARVYPVPHFVETVNGAPDFRVISQRTIDRCLKHGLCWTCGTKMMGDAKTFVIGPMCAVNRVAPEPPSHRSCARFAVVACPFLSKPLAKRRARTDDITYDVPAGLMIERNPGVSLLWVTRSFRTTREPGGGYLFRIGSPVQLEWYAEGRTATRDEIMASIESGLPILQEQAELDGPEAVQLLAKMTERGLKLVPAE